MQSYTSSNATSAPMTEKVLLPTQFVEKQVAVHEEIRKEVVQEVQPVVNVEKLKTEVHQVTQPLFDKEVLPVDIQNRTLATEVLPEVLVAGRGVNQPADFSTTQYLDTTTVVIEKPALFNEIQKTQIIEEIQPVIYKETIVPEVIQETKPVYQKIVEGPVYSQTTLPAEQVAIPSAINPGYVVDQTVLPPMKEKVLLPTQFVEKPVAVHEEVRKEVVEEIQPVINVEKLKTEVHQVTQPLFDREIRPVELQQRTLDPEVLPEVLVQGRGLRAAEDFSTTTYQATNTVIVEKPAQFREIEKTQIIEEIQPVIYKETVVPHVIKETKPVYQKIVEGPVYTQTILPPQSLSGSNYSLPIVAAPVIAETPVIIEREVLAEPIAPIAPVQSFPIIDETPIAPIAPIQSLPIIDETPIAPIAPVVQSLPIIDETPIGASLPIQMPPVPLDTHNTTIIEDTITTTTTTTVAPVLGSNMGTGNYVAAKPQKRGLFHRRSKDLSSSTSGTGVAAPLPASTVVGPYGTTAAPLAPGVSAPLGTATTNQVYTEKALPNGAKVIENTVSSSTHEQRTVQRV